MEQTFKISIKPEVFEKLHKYNEDLDDLEKRLNNLYLKLPKKEQKKFIKYLKSLLTNFESHATIKDRT